MVFTLGALKNLANFTGKTNLLESLFKKASIRSCKIGKMFKTTFLTEHLRWLGFKISNSNNMFKDFFRDTSYGQQISPCNSINDKLNLKMHLLTKNLFQ